VVLRKCSPIAANFCFLQIKAYQNDQKYKEGKFIIEKAYLKRVTRGKETA
jgi:hypothetical protein